MCTGYNLEPFLRVVSLTTQPSYKPNYYHETDFKFPGDKSVVEMFQSIYEQRASNPDFWDSAFADSRISHVKTMEWK